MKRTALIGTIVLSFLACLWLLLAWLSETESNYKPADTNSTAPNAVPTAVYQPHSFTAGEVAIYKIKLTGITLGKCTFRAELLDDNGTAQWRFTLKGGAAGGLVSYDATSLVNSTFNHSISYHTVQKDAASRVVDLEFDEKNLKVKRRLNGNSDGEADTKPNTLDPISVIFKFRELDLTQTGSVASHVSDGKGTFPVKVNVIGPQKIKIGDREFNAILVEPDLGNLRGVFNKNPEAKLQIWLSADAHRVPLRIRTKIGRGNFITELEDYQRPDSN
ncbi:MAG: DUF3108 domain-containing protein [Verrucomicrobiota bacterium]|nr:DUF3108 domain-containing protein [Verrucomicrobiota bacterium]